MQKNNIYIALATVLFIVGGGGGYLANDWISIPGQACQCVDAPQVGASASREEGIDQDQEKDSIDCPKPSAID